MKRLLLFLILGILITTASATETGNFESFCERTVWGDYCNDATPYFKFNYTGGCTSMNFTVWVYNLTTGTELTAVAYGTNTSIANDTSSSVLVNTSLVTGNPYYAFLNGTCGSEIMKIPGVVINIDTTSPSIIDPTHSETYDIVANDTEITFSTNASDTHLDTVWLNGSGANKVTMTCSGGVCTATTNTSYLGEGTEGSIVLNANANDTAGNSVIGNLTLTVDNTAPAVTVALKTDDADGIFQRNATVEWTITATDTNMLSVTLGGYFFSNSTNAWNLSTIATSDLSLGCENNCTYCTATATITDKAGNTATSSNSSLLVYPCIESNSGNDVTLDVSATATADVLTLTYVQQAAGNTTTEVYMPPVYYNASHSMCNYVASNVNRTEVRIGPLNSTTSKYCNVTVRRTSGDSGTVVIQEGTEISIKPPKSILPSAGVVVILLLWGVTEVVRRNR